MDTVDKKKKRKSYFSNQGNDQKRRKRLTLECGMRGFLCTCNFREKECVREAYNLLNEYAEKLERPEEEEEKKIDDNGEISSAEKNDEPESVKDKESEEEKADTKETETSSCVKIVEENKDYEDISTALNKEIEELKAETEKPLSEKKFQVVDTGVSNVIFIKSKVPDTLKFVMKIIEDIQETKQQKTRYLLRMLPIQVSCKAYLDDIKSKADILFEKYFAQEPKTFCIVFNRHSNSNLQRQEVIEDLAQIILKKNPGNKANLKNPEIAVVVEIVRAVCLLSVAPQYFALKKYNLLELSNKK